jgi:hypothetical protein
MSNVRLMDSLPEDVKAILKEEFAEEQVKAEEAKKKVVDPDFIAFGKNKLK